MGPDVGSVCEGLAPGFTPKVTVVRAWPVTFGPFGSGETRYVRAQSFTRVQDPVERAGAEGEAGTRRETEDRILRVSTPVGHLLNLKASFAPMLGGCQKRIVARLKLHTP
jgi:hypothetical protein